MRWGPLKAYGDARLNQRRLFWGATIVLGCFVAFDLFARRLFAQTVSAPKVGVGRQAFQAAFQVSTNAGAKIDTQTGGDASPLASTFFDPAVYDPDAPNPTPITQIGAKACLWPPTIWDVCAIDSSPREDSERGPWVRLAGDMDLRVGIYYNYIFYRRKPAYTDLPSVVEIALLTDADASSSPWREKLASTDATWYKASGNLRAGVWPRSDALYAWYRTDSNPTTEPFTELEVVYGAAGHRRGWEKIGTVSAMPGKTEVTLMGRRKPLPMPVKPELRFSTAGNFTIMQLADFHFSTEAGACRDTNNVTACPPGRDADLSSIDFLNMAIDQTKPDLIMLSGDQINGQGTSWSARSAILKVARLFENRTIPFAAVFGNHDGEETDIDKYDQMAFMQTLPNFVGSAGPDTVDGVGNYLLRLRSADPSHTHLFSVYALDSHAYANSLFSSSYDWIKDSQIRWYKEESANVTMLLRPYSPPDLSSEKGMFDIGSIGSPGGRIHRRQIAGQKLMKPNALAFWHIPLPEHDNSNGLPIDKNPVNQAPLVIGQAIELSGGGPKHNSHFFDALTSVTELGSIESTGVMLPETISALPEVKISAHGHQHLRASCERRKGIWSCFAGGSSYSGYGRTYFDRRVRVFHLSEYGERVETWQLVDSSATDQPAPGTPDELPPEGGIGQSELAAAEAQLEEAILEAEVIAELESEGVEVEGQGPQRRQTGGSTVRLKEVDRAVLVGRDALGAG